MLMYLFVAGHASVPFSQWKFMWMMRPNWHSMVLSRYLYYVKVEFHIYILIIKTSFIALLSFSWQHYIKLSELEKNRKLNDLLDALDFNQVVIFVKSVSRAAELNKLLMECNFPSICIHSGMPQEERYFLSLRSCLIMTGNSIAY